MLPVIKAVFGVLAKANPVLDTLANLQATLEAEVRKSVLASIALGAGVALVLANLIWALAVPSHWPLWGAFLLVGLVVSVVAYRVLREAKRRAQAVRELLNGTALLKAGQTAVASSKAAAQSVYQAGSTLVQRGKAWASLKWKKEA